MKKGGKASMGMLGKKHSPSTIEKIRISNLGKKRSETTKLRIKISKIGINLGNKHWNWNGGTSKLGHLVRVMTEYKQWRSDVFSRDGWRCQTCGKNGCYLTVHHKKSFVKIIKDNNITSIGEARLCPELWDIDNGITLCDDCHSLADNYYGARKK